MILTIEYKKNNKNLDDKNAEFEIYCDQEGLNLLLKKISALKKSGGHVHFMTPSWSGNELTEKKQGGEGNTLINHLCVMAKQT